MPVKSVDFMRGRGFPALAFLFNFRRCFNISKQEQQINEEIRDKEIRVISDDGEQLGIMSAAEALKIAESRNLDLVKIAPMAKPPVCKVMDYGKFRFEKAKKEKEAKKNQKTIEIKEIRLSLNIDTHDFDTKINHAKKFIASGNKVKVSIRFRGREMAHPELGQVIMNRCAEACAECASVEKPAKLEGRQMLMFLAPKSSK
ncbi:MAG: translation initiation factor IF-3 [Clostridia bacterium]|nr:translation initiation factor IF-3 [Clostridia bacterium]